LTFDKSTAKKTIILPPTADNRMLEVDTQRLRPSQALDTLCAKRVKANPNNLGRHE